MTLKFHSGLLKDIASMLNNKDNHNVIIHVKNQKYHAHSSILRARSPYFQDTLSADNIKDEHGTIIIHQPNITSTVFDMILK